MHIGGSINYAFILNASGERDLQKKGDITLPLHPLISNSSLESLKNADIKSKNDDILQKVS